MAEISLQITDTESLSSLAERQQQGFSVMRSAHIGNARAYNLAFANAGVSMLLVDHNVTGVDKNYCPESIIKDGKRWPIAELGQLSFRALVTEGSNKRYVDEFHSEGLRTAFPDTSIETNTSYLRRNESLVGEITRCAVASMPELFQRFVETDEAATSKDPITASRLAEQGKIIQLADDPRYERGALLPNEVDILANFVIELIASGRSEQYHVSGPDMVKYMTRPKSKDDPRTPLQIINTLYSELCLRSPLGLQFPDALTVKLIPGSAAKFATTTKRSDNLDNLLAAIADTKDELITLNKARGAFFKTKESKDKMARQSFIAASNNTREQIASAFRQVADQCEDLFVDATSAPFMSQYDVIDEGGLYVPEAVHVATMAEFLALDQDIQTLRRGAT